MKPFLIIVGILVALFFVGWLGLQIKPEPFQPYPEQTPQLQTISLPDGLPAPVERFYRTVYGEKKELGLAHYYLAFHSLKVKALPTALFHFKKAVPNLSPSDPRYSEAQRQIARLQKMRVRVYN